MSLTKLFSSPVETGTANIGLNGENAKEKVGKTESRKDRKNNSK